MRCERRQRRTEHTGRRWWTAAHILLASHRGPDVAISLTRQYFASPAKTGAAPPFRVHVQLGNALAAAGDNQGAAVEFAEARLLASGYRAAQRGPGHEG